MVEGVQKGRAEHTVRMELDIRNSGSCELVASAGGRMLKASSLSVSVRPRG